jgi:hypothetical protein
MTSSRVPYGGMLLNALVACSSAFCSDSDPPVAFAAWRQAPKAFTCASGEPDSSVMRSATPLRATMTPRWDSGFAPKKERMNAGRSVLRRASREGLRSVSFTEVDKSTQSRQ